MQKILKNNLITFIASILLVVIAIHVMDNNISRELSEEIKIWLCLIALLLILIWPLLKKPLAILLLSILTMVSAANYFRLGTELLVDRIDSYDVIHYYLGARYFKELGYYDLYPALILADHENRPLTNRLFEYRAQNKETGYQVRPIQDGIERGRYVRETRFTAERWHQFEHDFLYLQRNFQLTKTLWRTLVNDRGFNATPAWIFLMKPIAEWVPVEHIKWLCAVDILFLAIGLLAVRWAYGNTAALWGLLFFMLSYSLRWPVISWTFFRYDWVCALLLSLALIKKNYHFIAGWCIGIASLFRIFPAVWLFGPAAKGLNQLRKNSEWRQRLNKPLLLLATGFLVCVLLNGSATLFTLGAETAKTHAENISEHTQTEELSSRRYGFALGLAYDGNLLPTHISDEHKEKIQRQKPFRIFICAVLLLLLGWYLRNRDDDEAFAYGFIPFFLLATASYYYAITRITLIVLHASKLDLWQHRLALGMLFGLELFCNWAETVYPGHRVFLIGFLSWGLTAYTLYVLWCLYTEAHKTKRLEQEQLQLESRNSNIRKENRKSRKRGRSKNERHKPDGIAITSKR